MRGPEKLEVAARAVAAVHGMRLEELHSASRKSAYSVVRYEVAKVLRSHGASFTEIGEVLRRHRTTVRDLVHPRARCTATTKLIRAPRFELEVSCMYESVGQEFAAVRLARARRAKRQKP